MLTELNNTDWFIIYVKYDDGSKSVYTITDGKAQLYTKNELKTITSYLKKNGLNYEIHKVLIQVSDKIEEE